MPVINGIWVPKMFNKQFEIFDSNARALLVAGPRLSGKTRGVLHRLARHLWETDRARLAFFARTMKTSKDGGSWALMLSSILPEWLKSGLGMRITSETKGIPGPKTDGITRTPYISVRNMHGTESTAMLFSLDNDDQVEAKLKELEFSAIYFSEVDKFGDMRVLTVALPSLRMGHLTYEQQFWIGDCNPSEEGDESWLYKTFYLARNMTYDQYVSHQRIHDLPVLAEQDFSDFYSKLNVIEVLPADNPFVDKRQLQEVAVSCGADEGLYARHVLGKWVWGGGDASRHFRSIWGAGSLYTRGSIDGEEEDWIVILPSPICHELILGFDLGDVNHSAHILEKYYVNGKAHFAVIEELVTIGQEIGIDDFTASFMEILQDLEDDAGKKFSLERAWSDKSAIEKYSASSDTYPYLQVQAASEGRITLQEVHKAQAAGSRKIRVNLLKQLLREKRLMVSAKCLHTIAMFRNLRKGKDKSNFIVEDEHKHPFDSLSYALLAEMAEELEAGPQLGKASALPLEVHIR